MGPVYYKREGLKTTRKEVGREEGRLEGKEEGEEGGQAGEKRKGEETAKEK